MTQIDVQQLLARVRRMPPGERGPRLEHEAGLLELTGDETLGALIQSRLDSVAAQQAFVPFIEPDSESGLGKGDIHILETRYGQHVRVSFRNRGDNRVNHLLTAGISGSGKSCFLANIALHAGPHCSCCIIDTNRFFRKVRGMAGRFSFVRWSPDLRLNFFDAIDCVPAHQLDQTVISELCNSYSLQFAEYEISQVVAELRQAGPFNWPHVVDRLQRAQPRGFSRRGQYRDSALLVLSNLLNATNQLFMCSGGMSILELCSHNVVLELDGLLPEHQAYIVRSLFEFLCLAAMRVERRRPLLWILDEAQVIASQSNFAEKILRLRHAGIRLLMGFQNPSTAPVELIGNCDALVAFQLVERKDRERFGYAACFDRNQMQYLSVLEPGNCVCYLPRSQQKGVFLASVPHVELATPVEDIEGSSRQFLRTLSWAPLESEKAEGALEGRLDERQERFLRDVLVQEHEFSPLMKRFERAAIRSASVQGQVLRKLVSTGYIRIWTLAIGKGRPIKLVEPTNEALREFNVPWRKTRGVLPTRAATEFLYRKISRLPGWQVVREGSLGE
jgi:hypothetical protein